VLVLRFSGIFQKYTCISRLNCPCGVFSSIVFFEILRDLWGGWRYPPLGVDIFFPSNVNARARISTPRLGCLRPGMDIILFLIQIFSTPGIDIQAKAWISKLGRGCSSPAVLYNRLKFLCLLPIMEAAASSRWK
jgi:hypothetical protein